MFLSEAINDYAGYARSDLGHSPTTIITYRSRQRQFAAWLAATGTPDPLIEQVTASHIRRYSYHLSSKGQRPRTIRSVMNAIRALYSYLVLMGAATDNPGLDVRLPKKDAATRRLVNDQDLEKLLAAAMNQRKEFRVVRDRALLSVLIYCGLRRQEVLDLTLRCVNLEGKCLLVQQGKGRKARTIYPCAECLKALREWIGFRETLKLNHDWLFISEHRSRMGRQTLMNTLEDIKAIAGLRGDSHIKPHSIRHAAATRLMRNGADIKSIQVWLGHTSLNTTAIYLHTDEEQVRHIGEKASFGGASHPMAGAEVQPPADSSPTPHDYHRRRRSTR